MTTRRELAAKIRPLLDDPTLETAEREGVLSALRTLGHPATVCPVHNHCDRDRCFSRARPR